MTKIKKFNESTNKRKSLYMPNTVGELREFLADLPDDMGIVADVNGGGSSVFNFMAYTTDFDFPGEELLRISVD